MMQWSSPSGWDSTAACRAPPIGSHKSCPEGAQGHSCVPAPTGRPPFQQAKLRSHNVSFRCDMPLGMQELCSRGVLGCLEHIARYGHACQAGRFKKASRSPGWSLICANRRAPKGWLHPTRDEFDTAKTLPAQSLTGHDGVWRPRRLGPLAARPRPGHHHGGERLISHRHHLRRFNRLL